MEYGSLINLVCANQSQKELPADLKIGTGCTELCYSDRNPFEIVRIEKNKKGEVTKLTVREMDHKPGPNHKGVGYNDWILTPNPKGVKVDLLFRKGTKRRAPGWYALYSDNHWGNRFLVGHAEYYYDWSF